MISDERAEKALRFLAETDEEAALLFADMERMEYRVKAIRDYEFMSANGTVAERQAIAGKSERYWECVEGHLKATTAYKAVANKRSTEELVVRAWQTVSSNRRQGGI